MNVHSSLLGLYQPQDGWLFKLGTGWKYLLLLAISIPTFAIWTWWFTLLMLVIVLAVLWSSGISPKRSLNVGLALWMILVVLAGYQLITLRPQLALTSPGSILVAVLASRLLTLTTSTPELLDALVRALRPLKHIGLNPERIALMISIMVRSIPYLLGSFQDSRDAAGARGREGSLVSLLIPTMVNAVSYAQTTGEAIHARGLAERDFDSS